MEIALRRTLRGPNRWSACKALELLVTFPAADGDLGRADIVGRTLLGLQVEAGCPVAFNRAVAAVDGRIYQVIVEYSEEAVALKALDQTRALFEAAAAEASFDIDTAMGELRSLHQQLRLRPCTRLIVDAATRRGVPVWRMTDGDLVQLGWGCKQKRIWGAKTANTGAIADSISLDRDLTLRRLRDAGVPTPSGERAAPGHDHRVFVVGGRVVAAVRYGTDTDLSHEMHPDLVARVLAAAEIIGLDVCCVDVRCETVRRPLEDQAGAVLGVHGGPISSPPPAMGEAIVDTLFAAGEDGRIPVVAVTGTNGKTTTVRLAAHLLASAGRTVGMTCTDGVRIAEHWIERGDSSGPRSARSVLMHPDVDAAVFEVARGGLLREGLAFDRCTVAVVTNIGQGDHLGRFHINTAEEGAAVKAAIVRQVAQGGGAVLNAADPLVAAMAALCPAEILYFALDPLHPVIALHRAAGGRAIFVEEAAICGAAGDAVQWRIPLDGVPLTLNGALHFHVENAMAACGAAWALGLTADQVARGLASFTNSVAMTPGRFNLFGHHGATVIADYGHNPDGVRALIQAVATFPARRRHVVVAGCGDRGDADIRELTRLLGDTFDRFVLYQDLATQRGRADGEVLALLREGLAGAQRASDVEDIRGEFLAIDAALAGVEEGDLCLILVDQVDEALAHIGRSVDGRGRGGASP